MRALLLGLDEVAAYWDMSQDNGTDKERGPTCMEFLTRVAFKAQRIPKEGADIRKPHFPPHGPPVTTEKVSAHSAVIRIQDNHLRLCVSWPRIGGRWTRVVHHIVIKT